MSSPKTSEFYLGRLYDPAKGGILPEPVLYDPSDLTTHAVVTGMTGSGKTGACIVMLEEAARLGIPAIIIDPKGDLTNLLLHFPNLAPQDFEPWLDPEEARRAGKSLPVLAEETAQNWRKGLADWGLGREDLLNLQTAVQYGVYTPGSSAGTSINILSSFAAPEIAWDTNREILREKIASTVTAVLGLIGLTDIDPLRSREHILLSNLLETAWSQGKSLDLTELIMQVQNPPIQRLGAFPLDNFFPAKDRFDLAMLLNNFLAAPSFQTWLEGQSLDIPSILYTPDSKPRHSIFYLAHLGDNERMFFVTLLLSAVEAWMRTQRGTSGLRAILYFDEILGYLPPVANPPSRQVLIRMLKQARAFGVGLLLATQNPVDLDYKALSNAGTWIIGRLQTERDVMRLLDGLQESGAALDRGSLERMITGMAKRVFLLHNVHSKGARLYHTRWALNFLAGPLTRNQIPQLAQLTGSAQPMPAQSVPSSFQTAPEIPPQPAPASRASAAYAQPAPAAQTGERYSATRPASPVGLQEYFFPNTIDMSEASAGLNLPPTLSLQAEGVLYRPTLVAQAEARYLQRKYNLDYSARTAVLIRDANAGRVQWENNQVEVIEAGRLHSQPLPQARFAPLPGWLSEARRVKSLETDFVDWVYRSGAIRVRANEKLKVYAGPETSSAEFRELCSAAARQAAEAEIAKIETTYERKIDALEQKLDRQKLEVEEQKDEVEQRRIEELGTHGELLVSIFSKRKRSLSSSLTKRRMTQQAKSNLLQEQEELKAIEKQLDQLEEEYQAAIKQAQDRWAQTVNDMTEVPLSVMKKDIFVELFGIAWIPYYLIRVNDEIKETPAYRSP